MCRTFSLMKRPMRSWSSSARSVPRKTIKGLSSWYFVNKGFSFRAIKRKNSNFATINLSLTASHRTWNELQVGTFEFFPDSILHYIDPYLQSPGSYWCILNPSCGTKLSGNTSDPVMSVYVVLLWYVSWNKCHKLFKIISISQPLFWTPVRNAPCTTCRLHVLMSITSGISGSAFCLSSTYSLCNLRLTLGPSIPIWVFFFGINITQSVFQGSKQIFCFPIAKELTTTIPCDNFVSHSKTSTEYPFVPSVEHH